MENSGLVRGLQSIAELPGDPERFVWRNLALTRKQGGERFAPQKLHHAEAFAFVFGQIEDVADVGVLDFPRHADFAEEPRFQLFLACGDLADELQGDGARFGLVEGFIDLAHAAASKKLDDAIAAADDRAVVVSWNGPMGIGCGVGNLGREVLLLGRGDGRAIQGQARLFPQR